MAKTAKGLVNFAKKCVGRPYIYGTFGLILTEQLINQKAAQYPKYVTKERAAIAKSKYIGKRSDDCCGLLKNYLWCPGDDPNQDPVYNAKTDLSANGMYEAAKVKGPISTMPDKPGICVRYSGHVGIYIGNGEVVEARGFDYGVVITKLEYRSWTDWYECAFITYEEEIVPENPFGLPVLSKGMKTNTVYTAQILLNGFGMKGKNGESLEVDGSFGGNTQYAVVEFQKKNSLFADGVIGEKTWKKLLRV